MAADDVLPCDCLIVGGGPAGAALAWLLAGDSRVVLVEAGRARHSGPFESLLPNALRALDANGLGDVVRGAATSDELRHGAIWGSDELGWRRPDTNERGLGLRRGAFDAALRHAAAARGATVVEPARLVGDLASAIERGITIVPARDAARVVRPRCVVVATGRRSACAPIPTRTIDEGPRTLALTFVGPRHERDRDTAVVEAAADGWTWFQSPAGSASTVAVLLDADDADPVGVRARRLLATCRGPAHRLAEATIAFAVDATPRCTVTAAPVFLVGDAAATIDPLASQGVEKALAAADHAAACVRTLLRDERLATMLKDEHRRWEHGLFAAHTRQSLAFHAAETRFAERAFWRRRRFEPPPRSVVMPQDTWRLADGITTTTVLRRVGEIFEPCDGAAFGEQRVSHLGFVPIAPLLAAFATPTTIAEALQRVGRDARCFVLPPFAVQQAMRELVQRGWLVSDASAAGSP